MEKVEIVAYMPAEHYAKLVRELEDNPIIVLKAHNGDSMFAADLLAIRHLGVDE